MMFCNHHGTSPICCKMIVWTCEEHLCAIVDSSLRVCQGDHDHEMMHARMVPSHA